MTEPKRALVTGGSRGIGAAIARRFAAAGWQVCLTYRSGAAEAQAVVAQIEATGGNARALPCDQADPAAVEALFARLDADGWRPQALINNAGVTGPKTRLEDADTATLRAVCDVNLLGVLVCCREAVRRMSTRHGGAGGAIVNISSTAVRMGSPNQWVHYAASKGALDVLTAGLAREVGADGVRVNAVSPGLILNDPAREAEILARFETMRHEVPLGRVGTVEEIAEVVHFLCTDAAAYITGAVLPVAGGR